MTSPLWCNSVCFLFTSCKPERVIWSTISYFYFQQKQQLLTEKSVSWYSVYICTYASGLDILVLIVIVWSSDFDMQGKVRGVLNSVFVLHMWIYRHCKYLDIKIDYILSRPLKKKNPYYRGLKQYPRQYSQEQRECIKSRDSAHLPGVCDATSRTVALLPPPPAIYCRKDIQQRSLLLQHMTFEKRLRNQICSKIQGNLTEACKTYKW